MMKTRMRIGVAVLLAGLAAPSVVAQTRTVHEHATPAVQPERSQADIDRIVGAMKDAKKAEIDRPAPDFRLVDTAGKEHVLSDYVAAGNVVVLEWFNPECPYVQEHYNTEGKGTSNTVEKEFKDKKVVWLRINSSDAKIPLGTKEVNDEAARNWKITGPILLDGEGKVGRAYGAKATPTLVVVSPEGVLSYQGAMDSDVSPSRTGEIIYPREAVKSVLAHETVATKTTRAVGCGIHYAKKTSD
jgi:peroxiredoxin